MARDGVVLGHGLALEDLGFFSLTYDADEGAEYLRDMTTWPG